MVSIESPSTRSSVAAFRHSINSLEGGKADEAFSKHADEDYYVVPSDDQHPAYRCSGAGFFKAETPWLFLESISYTCDLYVVAVDLKWTMVFTHEIDCGPYYARYDGSRRATLRSDRPRPWVSLAASVAEMTLDERPIGECQFMPNSEGIFLLKQYNNWKIVSSWFWLGRVWGYEKIQGVKEKKVICR